MTRSHQAAGAERILRIVSELRIAQLDAVVCTLPSNVLLLSGYWPVVGPSVAIATAEGTVAVLAPEDEEDLATSGWADNVHAYSPTSLANLDRPPETVHGPLRSMIEGLGLQRGRLGFEDQSIYEGSSYAATYAPSPHAIDLLGAVAPEVRWTNAQGCISRLRSSLTEFEVNKVRTACAVAARAFEMGVKAIHAGVHESEVAAAFQTPIVVDGLATEGVRLAEAYVFCMSGPNSANAGGAYARSSSRRLETSDLVLVHCNSTVDGYWTDITRTFVVGEPDARQRTIYDAILEARSAALSALSDGVSASVVDGAARNVLTKRGFGREFTHGLGHNVGLSVISPDFPPRLSPSSPDQVVTGMTFNIEPAIYLEGYGGVRHCDVVTMTRDGPEVLTPFQAELIDLTILQ